MHKNHLLRIYYRWCNNITFRDISGGHLLVPKKMFTAWKIDFIKEAKRRTKDIEKKILTPEQIIRAIKCYKHYKFKLLQFKIIHTELKIINHSSAELFKIEIDRLNCFK